ncbi:MAG: hypothetical protein ACMZ66_20395 [Thalassospira sp.]|uniref:hypothetical protein n=1 Tax=Thalassospira sp. TaxID=1912094 RepID=UPI003A8B7C3B
MAEQRFRILLVEDNPGDAFLVKTLLEETGEPFDIEHHSDLTSAMAVLNGDGAQAKFDVVLLDLTLPIHLVLKPSAEFAVVPMWHRSWF